MLIRQKLVEVELAAAALGIHEVGGNNRGPWIKKFLAATGLPEGYAWCDAFQSFEIEQAAGKKLPIESAGVWNTVNVASQRGWIVKRPFKGDLVAYDLNGDGVKNDHIGLVVKVLHIDPVFVLIRTVEGNTGSGNAGSQSDGDGVFIRVRMVRRSSVTFIRIPGKV